MKNIIKSHYFKVFFLFVVLTIIVFYPLSIKFQTHINDNNDTLFLIWVFSWWKHILGVNPLDFLNSNALYPDKMTLAYSTFMYAKAPFFLFFDLFFNNKIASYNLTVFSSFVISGVAAYTLMYHYTKNKIVALFSGFIYAFSPIKTGHMSLAQVLNLEYFPFAVLFLEKYFSEKKNKNLVLFSIFSLLQILSEGYVAFIYVLGMLIFILIRFGKKIFNKKLIAAIIIQIIISVGFYFPYIYLLILKPFVFKKELIYSIGLSTTPKNIFALSWELKNSLFDKVFSLSHVRPDASLYFGILAIGLCVYYIFVKTKQKKFVWYLLFIVFVVLSFGPYWILENGQPIKLPYYYFWKLIPGFSIMRSTGRFALGAVFPVAVISGFAIDHILNKSKNKIKLVIVIVSLLFLTADYFFLPFNNQRIVEIPKIYNFLQKQQRGAVFEFPFRTEKDFFIDKDNYYSTVDFFPRVMSYSSSYSETFQYFKFLERTDLLYTKLLVDRLKEIKTPYIIVHKEALKKSDFEKFVNLITSFDWKKKTEINGDELYVNKKYL